MINKIQVGGRISSLRKEHGYSQNDFAEKLGVTPQAVSKWENGLALPDIEILLNISWIFQASINEILEGRNIFTKIANRSFKMTDIAYFVEEEYDVEWAKNMIAGQWVKNNWNSIKNNGTNEFGEKIAGHGGLILELGAGPGGGFVPATLKQNFNSNIILSDLSPTVAREWKKVFDAELNPPNVHYAALDSCDLPFIDNCIDVISIGGFKNTVGDKEKAVREIYRVLKPGGLFLASDGLVTQDMLKSLPEPAQKAFLEKLPYIFEDYYEASVRAGFKKIDSFVQGSYSTEADKSTPIYELAHEFGVEILITWYFKYCIK